MMKDRAGMIGMIGMIGMKMTGKIENPETTSGKDLKDEAKDMRKAKEKDVESPRAKEKTRARRDLIKDGGRLLRSLRRI